MLIALGLATQLLAAVPTDTPPPRPRVQAIEVSDWYNRRLTIHRWLAYGTIPLFGFQYAAGTRIWNQGPRAPAWARNGHRAGAATLAGVFTVNTVTGVWNLWDSRHVEQRRALRYFHAATMHAADPALTWAAARLPDQ